MDCAVLEDSLKGIEIRHLLGVLIVGGGGKKGKGNQETNPVSCCLDY